MKALVGLGSNMGDRRGHLELSAQRLQKLSHGGYLKASPLFETPALLPEKQAPSVEWYQPYLNAVVEIDWRGEAEDLLKALQSLETECGRTPHPNREHWAPRTIDLDLLTLGESQVQSDFLRLPHPEISKRSFVISPIKHLQSNFKIPGQTQSALQLSRQTELQLPVVMGILNITPDSFSDGGDLSDIETFTSTLKKWDQDLIAIFDLGAESTRPGASPLSADEEWSRLAPALEITSDLFRRQIFRPRISVDTYHAGVAEKALTYGADIINDVSAMSDPRMRELLTQSRCEYVLMHSLTIPADPKVVMSSGDMVASLKQWFDEKLNELQSIGVSMDRIVFDPGIGFGKSAHQSIQIMKNIREFLDLPVRILIGHSRKSFLKTWTQAEAQNRDLETLGLALKLGDIGVDILRLHNPQIFRRVQQTFQEIL